jgi:hypothetical protein
MTTSPRAASLGVLASLAFNNERLGLGRRTVIDGESVSGLEQIGGHAAAHVPKPDESNLHDLQLLNAPGCAYRSRTNRRLKSEAEQKCFAYKFT